MKQFTPDFYSDAPVTNVFAKVKLSRNAESEAKEKSFNISIKMP